MQGIGEPSTKRTTKGLAEVLLGLSSRLLARAQSIESQIETNGLNDVQKGDAPEPSSINSILSQALANFDQVDVTLMRISSSLEPGAQISPGMAAEQIAKNLESQIGRKGRF